MNDKPTTITDIINELKRLQVEFGDLKTVARDEGIAVYGETFRPAWPTYNEKENRIEF